MPWSAQEAKSVKGGELGTAGTTAEQLIKIVAMETRHNNIFRVSQQCRNTSKCDPKQRLSAPYYKKGKPKKEGAVIDLGSW